jgi:hypothetical protein
MPWYFRVLFLSQANQQSKQLHTSKVNTVPRYLLFNRKHSSKMSTVIRLFVKPRAIPGFFPATATHLWMNTRYWQSVQQRRMFVTEDSGESSELQPERKIKRVFPGEEAKVALICPA